jgi:beta-glucanase (GH16 family)
MRANGTSVFLAGAVGLAVLLPGAAAAEWELSFEEHFEEAELDRQRWKTTDYWGNQTLAGNGELQCYQPDAFRIDDGILQIIADRGATPADECWGAQDDLQYTSGMITTAGCNRYDDAATCRGLESFAQRYGYFEMRARFPSGSGLWPAFWLMPEDGAWPPEIDVVEWIGTEPDQVVFSIHLPDEERERHRESGSFRADGFSDDFHVYGLKWMPERLVWYVDGVERFRIEGPHVPSEAMYLLVNLAVGGHWPGAPDESVEFPVSLEVDFVRAWAWTGTFGPDTPPDGSG